MEHLNIIRITEKDFDQIIEDLGGKRLSEDESREERENADYILNDAIIELKIVEEDPSTKISTQDKLARLFSSEAETVIIDPLLLDKYGRRQYYRILETPIKSHVKKAARQLKSSQAANSLSGPRIAIVINNGLYAHTSEEFEETTFKCASNDTSAIDILLVGGVYYYSDTFKMYAFPRLSPYYINGKFDCKEVTSLITAWTKFVDDYMTRVILDVSAKRTKEPVKDICFEKDDIRYVKPTPRLGPSKFWSGRSRPRMDTTGIETCPPVGRIIPRFSLEGYEVAMREICDKEKLHNSYEEYAMWIRNEKERSQDRFCPVIDVELSLSDCSKSSYYELCDLATDRFDRDVRELADKVVEFSESHVALTYVLVVSREIGVDKANDIAWISIISEMPNLEKKCTVINGKRLKFEHALMLGSAYAVLHGCPQVYYIRDQKYMWF